MMMGIGLALATLGAILRYAVDDNSDALDLDTIGLIMMIVGTVAFLTGFALEVLRSRRAAPMPYAPAPMAHAHPPAAPHVPAAPPQPTPPPPAHPH